MLYRELVFDLLFGIGRKSKLLDETPIIQRGLPRLQQMFLLGQLI